MKKWILIIALILICFFVIQTQRHAKKEPIHPLSETVLPNSVTALCLRRDTLFAGLGDGIIEAWDLLTSRRTVRFVAHDGAIRKLLCADETLISVGARGSAAVWNTNHELQQRHRLKGHHINDAVATEDGSLIVGGDRGKIARLGGDQTWQVQGAHGRGVLGIAISPKDDRVYTVGTDGVVNTWATGSGIRLNQNAIASHWLHTIQLQGQHLWVGGAKGEVYYLTPKNVFLQVEQTQPNTRLIGSASTDQVVAFGSETGEIHLINTQTKALIKTAHVSDTPILALALDGARLAVGIGGTAVRIYPEYDKDTSLELKMGGE